VVARRPPNPASTPVTGTVRADRAVWSALVGRADAISIADRQSNTHGDSNANDTTPAIVWSNAELDAKQGAESAPLFHVQRFALRPAQHPKLTLDRTRA